MEALPLPTSLLDLYHVYKSLPYQYVLIGHCLFCAALAPELKDKFFIHYWMTFLAGFGGGTLSSVLIQNPAKASIAMFANNAVGVTFTICWWCMNYIPYNPISKLHSFWFVKIFTKACMTLLRAQLIIARVDVAVELFPGVIAAPLILGTIAGTGGKFITEALRHGWGLLKTEAEASSPSFVWRSGFLGALAYYVAAHHLRVMLPQEAAAILITILLVHSLLADISGMPLDFTYPVFKPLFVVGNIPMGKPAPAAKPKENKQAAKPDAKPAVSTAAKPATSKPSNGTATPASAVTAQKPAPQAASRSAPAPAAKAPVPQSAPKLDANKSKPAAVPQQSSAGKKESKKKR